MSDLVQRLRDYQAMLDHMGVDNKDTGLAADEIEQWREWFEDWQLNMDADARANSPANPETPETTKDVDVLYRG